MLLLLPAEGLGRKMQNSLKASFVLVLVAFGAGLLLSKCCHSSAEEQDLSKLDWWKKTNFYHIYLRSFKDSNGDGNGDLRGVIEKLDYLKQIGVESILMAPFYASPMKDCGYDISNYIEIEPMFGVMRDFNELVSELHQRAMRLVVDFVPNHSSNKHPWFICSERALADPANCAKYKDYYVWTNSTRGKDAYPSNWVSVLGGGPAWTWSSIRQEYYLHQFLPEQPDLNFTNPAVREEFKEIARFWLRKGADGLRVDSAIYLIEDTANGFQDEPLNAEWKEGDDPADRLDHIYTRSQPQSVDIVREWRDVASEPEFEAAGKRVIITEAYAKIPKLIEYYGKSAQSKVADLPFNFELFKLKKHNLSGRYIEEVVRNWIDPTRDLRWPDEQAAMAPWIIWVTGNHDNPRLVNRIGRHNVEIIRWLTYFVPGSPVNYYGDEIPLHDANFNSIPQKTINEGEWSRLPERAPIAWTPNEPNGGFSSAAQIWMPLNADWRTTNVESQLAAGSGQSHLKQFIELQELRQKHMKVFVFGDCVFFQHQHHEQNKILAIARTHQKFGSLMLIANLNDQNELVLRLEGAVSVIGRARLEPPKRAKIVMTNYENKERAPKVEQGAEVELDKLILARSQAIIVQY